ncbi:MAG TPA: hypothetical protein VFA89_13395 [Terriglobales bacterium]|nr:hypothetical protein [Terriglobales bacterium]
MRLFVKRIGSFAAAMLLTGALALPSAMAGGKQTFTGEVSDSMCGAKHMMPGNAAECAHACVKKGAKYALVVGDKVYTLDTSDQSALDTLDKLAGAKAKVTGTAKGDTIEVASVAPAK